MITGIHHLNFLVRELEPNIAFLEAVFQTKPEISSLPERHVKTATFKLAHSFIVLVCPISEVGEPAKILASRGEGLFLVSFNTLSLDDTLKRLSEHDIFPVGEPRKGLQDWLVNDLASPPALGPIFQLCQPNG